MLPFAGPEDGWQTGRVTVGQTSTVRGDAEFSARAGHLFDAVHEEFVLAARDLLTCHREALDRLTAALLEHETVTGDQVRALAQAPSSARHARPVPVTAAEAARCWSADCGSLGRSRRTNGSERQT